MSYSPQALAGLKATTAQAFARTIARRLKKRGALEGADYVLVITPNAIDYLGRQYSAFMDFLSASPLVRIQPRDEKRFSLCAG
jgi:hypothetical protein